MLAAHLLVLDELILVDISDIFSSSSVLGGGQGGGVRGENGGGGV